MMCDDAAARCTAGDDDAVRADAMAIDLDHLARYTLGNRALQEEVLGLFRDQSEIYLHRLRESPDSKAWAEAAHTLKGSARSVGAIAVAEGAERAEALAGDPGSREHAAALLELGELIGEANRFIERELNGAAQDA